jgi:hypothetical protein
MEWSAGLLRRARGKSYTIGKKSIIVLSVAFHVLQETVYCSLLQLPKRPPPLLIPLEVPPIVAEPAVYRVRHLPWIVQGPAAATLNL